MLPCRHGCLPCSSTTSLEGRGSKKITLANMVCGQDVDATSGDKVWIVSDCRGSKVPLTPSKLTLHECTPRQRF